VERADCTDLTLIAHSWGGFVAAGAAPRLTARLKRMVFWSAFVPQSGCSLLDELPPDLGGFLSSLAAASPDNTALPPLDIFHQAFMNDASSEAAALVHSTLRGQPFRTFTDEPVGGEAYRHLGIPFEYVFSSEDLALPAGEFAWVPRMPDRCNTVPRLVPGSHESMLTRPAELARGLLEACAGH
jgi:pimeloyl-ACP methyl ester carboxylesterase